MTKSTSRERRHERTRKSILLAAHEIVIKEGLEELSLRAVARRIDYSPAALYEYFDGKDEIVSTLCSEADARLAQYMDTSDADLGVSERIVEAGLGYIRFATENPEEFKLLFMTTPSSRNSLADSVNPEGSYGVLLNLIGQAVEAGSINLDDMNLEGVTYSLWAFVHGMAVLQLTYLRAFEADFAAADRRALTKYLQALN